MAKSNGQPIRFAALVRVSDKKQKERGESLRTQTTRIAQVVAQLDGVISRSYVGQEHATAGYERKLLDQLLADAAKTPRPFDAVIVADPTRWSRDNVKSEIGLEILKINGIRFFVLTTEHDLHSPEARLFLALSAIFAAYHERIKKQQSMLNKIHRTRRGIPAVGNLPIGRTFDKKTETWVIDESVRRKYKTIANRYLEGESLRLLANEFGLEYTTLNRNLSERCGDTWEVSFDDKDLNICETVTMSVPRLLPEETIQAIRRQKEANKTYEHGQSKNPYLLGRMIFCDHCGRALIGQTRTTGNKVRYYRHIAAKSGDFCPCRKSTVYCEVIEANVLRKLFDVFGNPIAVQRAIEAAMPNIEKRRQAQEQQENLAAAIEKLERGRQGILRQIKKGTITEDQASASLIEINVEEANLRETLNRNESVLQDQPSPNAIRTAAKRFAFNFKRTQFPVHRRFRKLPVDEDGLTDAWLGAKFETADNDFDGMTWEEKRGLLQLVFGGKMSDGNRMGVYVRWINGENGKPPSWQFSIRGQITEEGLWPMRDDILQAIYDENPLEPYDGHAVNNVGLALSLPITPSRGGWRTLMDTSPRRSRSPAQIS